MDANTRSPRYSALPLSPLECPPWHIHTKHTLSSFVLLREPGTTLAPERVQGVKTGFS